jgi:hypothetical protein
VKAAYVALPSTVAHRIDGYLRAADDVVPDLLEGLYVTGSIALGDYWPAVSDIDLVAVCGGRPSESELKALSKIHKPGHPSVDVLYVTRDDLRTDPTRLSPPHSLLGTFKRDGGFDANPVVWRIMSTKAMPVRGPQLADADVWFDADALRRWNLANLDAYWVGRVKEWCRRKPTERAVRHEYGLQWLVLGVPRLHHTIATLGVTSKTGAGHYALGVVDSRWHEVIETAIALRAAQDAPLPRSPKALCQDAVDLSTWLIEDAHRRIEA